MERKGLRLHDPEQAKGRGSERPNAANHHDPRPPIRPTLQIMRSGTLRLYYRAR